MEPSNALYYVTSTSVLALLIGFYFFGVWSRNYLMPPSNSVPLRRQLVAAIPVSLVTMGLYAKSAFPALTQPSASIAFDAGVMAGYAIIYGMLSRETLERLLQSALPSGGKL